LGGRGSSSEGSDISSNREIRIGKEVILQAPYLIGKRLDNGFRRRRSYKSINIEAVVPSEGALPLFQNGEEEGNNSYREKRKGKLS